MLPTLVFVRMMLYGQLAIRLRSPIFPVNIITEEASFVIYIEYATLVALVIFIISLRAMTLMILDDTGRICNPGYRYREEKPVYASLPVHGQDLFKLVVICIFRDSKDSIIIFSH